MIEFKDDIEAELVAAETIDQQAEQTVNSKLLETVFKPTMGSEEAICINQSRNITC
ncbi:hypothetical protein Q670_02400 [Alcanivorax sp. P2S70]|jgi:hypothetical protein|uniref:hypothetical protein n=1 Tax=Alcanivorax TaxID=59753 RepID=UPI0003B4429B|nr:MULTISPECIES: hypothetical protein [Alcanivorax]ERP89246.1 hypothetical protein Q670_02400 [Alcanivorax sp. P2S70]|tara:strand:+ start:2733 stop:2900 length:168 start_codon:yes stop_codon:yes gene_type:complete